MSIASSRAARERLPTTMVVFDTETTGLDPAFDQVLQIAAIKTDAEFNESSASARKFSYRARLRSHIVPAPAAMMTTGLRPADLEQGMDLADMMVDVHQLFSAWGPAIFLGFNNINFDERVLRHAFFAALLPPYVTQSHGSTRADLLRIAQVVAALAPEAITIPVNPEGRRTFRLGPLARANGVSFNEATAHEALADVRATAALARQLKAAAPIAFDDALARADKTFAKGVFFPRGVVLALKMVLGNPVVLPVVPLAIDDIDKNAVICASLNVPADDLVGASDDDLTATMSGWPRPLFKIKLNAQPLCWRIGDPEAPIDRLLSYLPLDSGAPPPTEKLLRDRADRLIDDLTFTARVKRLMAAQQAARPAADFLENRLYDGFADQFDFRFAQELHQAMPDERASLIAYLRDPRLREHAERLVFETAPSSLDAGTREQLTAWRRARLLGPPDAPWRTIAAARVEVAELSASAPEEAVERLAEFARWLDRLEAKAKT